MVFVKIVELGISKKKIYLIFLLKNHQLYDFRKTIEKPVQDAYLKIVELSLREFSHMFQY